MCPQIQGRRRTARWFELTGQVTPIPSPALVDVVGRVPGRASGKSLTGSQPTTSLSLAGSYMPPVAAGRAPRVEVTVPPA